jgi:phosphopantothenoylcysteine decarboxylase / phosphopantothenate---cysteine ligase
MIIKPINNKNIVLGVTGSIAAYKAADLASKLSQGGALVDVVLTPAALQFITPLTFQSVTGRNAYVEADLWGAQAHVLHVGLAHQADALLIAPATANTIAKLVSGTADNLLTLTTLAYGTNSQTHPLLIAPAMDAGMFAHPATQSNLDILVKRGAETIGPEVGHLASGLTTQGRMSEPIDILNRLRNLMSRNGPLQGKQVIVTAGGTQEPIDPVRLLTNRSSGKQGFALAQAALDYGAKVTLIASPVSLPIPSGAQHIPIQTATQMEEAVLQACQDAHVLIMAGAVADFRPTTPVDQKIKRGSEIISLTLEPTADILAAVARLRQETGQPGAVIGFAAESQDLIKNAQAKMSAKNLDMIVANDISAMDSGFDVDTNRVVLLRANGEIEELPLMSKMEVADRIIQAVLSILGLEHQG